MSSTPVIPLAARGRASDDEIGPFVRPARLVRGPGGDLFAEVVLGGAARRVPAEAALPGPLPPEDTPVLVTGESAARCYVIGVLGAPADGGGPASERRVRAAGGASAEIVSAEDGERIVVRDAEGRPLFEHCPSSGRTVVAAPEGDLVLTAPNGHVEIVSGGEIRCRGASVDLRAAGAEGGALHVGRGDARLSGRVVEVAAERGRVHVVDMAYRGLRLDATLERARTVAAQVESVTGRLVQRAKSLFRQVEDVEHVTAGRMRTVVEGSYVVQGGSASIQTEDDVKIDGKRVYLG